MNSSLAKYTLVITLSGFIAACSNNPKPAEPLIAAATPVLLPEPAPATIVNTPRGPSLTLDDVLFDFEQATLRTEAERTVARAVTYLQENPESYALIEGHTDHTGESDYNQHLSTQRSDAIGNALITRGINPDRITTVGFGESKPIADNETLEGRQSNRRVEIIFKANRFAQ